MMANELIKLQTSLTDVINNWLETEDTTALDTYIGDHAAELMASSAFNVLLAHSDLTTYLTREGKLTD